MQKEILKHVSEKIRSHIKDWSVKTLNPLMEEKSDYIFEVRNSELNYIYKEINNISGQIAGRSGESDNQIIHPIVDIFPKGSIQISDFDYKKFTLSLSASVGAGAALFWLLSIPSGGALVMGIMMAIRAAVSAGKGGALDKLKKKITTDICESINKNSIQKADEYVNEIREHFINIAQKLTQKSEVKNHKLKRQYVNSKKERPILINAILLLMNVRHNCA